MLFISNTFWFLAKDTYQSRMVSLSFYTAEIEIPERVEVFRADDSETEFAYPVRVVAKHLARRARLIGGRWIFELDGRGYYVKDATLTAFGLRPKITQVPVLRLADFRGLVYRILDSR